MDDNKAIIITTISIVIVAIALIGSIALYEMRENEIALEMVKSGANPLEARVWQTGSTSAIIALTKKGN